MPIARAPVDPAFIVLAQGGTLTPGGEGQATGTQAGEGQTGQTQTPQGTKPPDMCGGSSLMMFLPFLLILYFLVLRPQQKTEKKRRAMLSDLKKGDDVVTTGGVHGQVAALGDTTITIKFGSDPGQRFKVDRGSIQRVIPKEEPKQE